MVEHQIEDEPLLNALGYIELGFPVYQVVPGEKKPLRKGGYKDATLDEAVVRTWFMLNPNANIALATGDRFLAVDVDKKSGGYESLALIKERFGADIFEGAHRVRTGGGGEHIYCRPVPNTVSTSLPGFPGIDIKSFGGGVVAPPSRHPSGSLYVPLDDDISALCALPDAFIAILPKKGDRSAVLEAVENGDPIRDGQRYEYMRAAAGSLRHNGLEPEEILEVLRLRNQARCVPPSPDTELVRLAKDAGGWPIDRALVCAQEYERKTEGTPLGVQWANDVIEVPTDDLWERRLPLGALSALIGPPSVGKTFLTCEVAAALSVGRVLPGITDGRKGKSLIYAGEDSASTITARLRVCGADLTQIALVNDRDLPFGFDRIPAMEVWLEEHPDVLLVIIDPIAVILTGKNENSDTEVRDCLKPVNGMAERRHVSVLFGRHTTKDITKSPLQRIIGSVAFGAVPRSVLFLEEDKKTRKRAIFHIKNNIGPTVAPVEYYIDGAGWTWGDVDDTLDQDDFARSAVPLNSGLTRKHQSNDEIKDWLTQLLAEGPLPALVATRLAKAQGFSEKRVASARQGLVLNDKLVFQGPSYWFIPQA